LSGLTWIRFEEVAMNFHYPCCRHEGWCL